MNYSNLRNSINDRTKELIVNKNWDELLRILQICPEQISSFRLFLEEKLKVSKELNEFPVEKIIYNDDSQDDPNRPFIYYKFTKFFNLIIELLNIKIDIFSQEFKDKLCEILYPKITDLLQNRKNRISSIEKFIERFYPEIRQKYFNDFINQYFLLDYLIKKKPNDLVDFFPKIVSKGLYQLGYELIVKYNELIQLYDSETREVLGNIILYEKQYSSLIELLEKDNRNLINIVEENRRKLKNEFYNKFINYTRERLNSESFRRNPEDTFSYTFDLYSDEELSNLIQKIIELKITYSHFENRLIEHGWINLILLDIIWEKKSYLFENYLGDLARLGYLQVVRTYYGQFPEKIKASQEFIIDKLDSFALDLLQWHYEAFEFDNPVDIFKKLVFKDLPVDALKIIFFNKHPELITHFKEAIKEYIDIKLREEKFENRLFFKMDRLLAIIYQPSPKLDPNTKPDINLLERVYAFFLSKPIYKEDLFLIHDTYLANNFNLLAKSLQKEFLHQLIETKNLSSIEFLLRYGYKHLTEFLEDIIDFEPEHDLQSEHFVKILNLILRNSRDNKKLQDTIKNRLKNLVLCREKAETYSFLGDYYLSKEVLEEILRSEIIIPYAINTYLDYQLVNIELSTTNSILFDFSTCFNELPEIEKDFKNFNSSSELIPNYKFKLSSYKARLNLYMGFHFLSEQEFSRGKTAFIEASKLYQQLTIVKNIDPTTKEIFNILWKISNFFDLYNTRIRELITKRDANELNALLYRNLIQPVLNKQSENLQLDRLLTNLKNLKFDFISMSLNFLKCEIPTKFCPIPPEIKNKRILNDKEEVLIEWDKENKTQNFEPIEVYKSNEKFIFELNFIEKDKFFDFKITCEEDTTFQVKVTEKKPRQTGKNAYDLDINITPFRGLKYLILNIVENNICGYEFEIPIPVHFKSIEENQQNLKEEYIRILHVSDIQEGKFGIKEDLKALYKENWQREYKLELNDLKIELKKIHDEKPVNIIVISGDLASMGKKEEYESLTREFIPILEQVFINGSNPVSKKNWIIAPGNHDVQWDMNKGRFNEYINFCQKNGFHSEFRIDDPFSIFDLISINDENNNIRVDFMLCNSCLDIYNEESSNQANLPREYFYTFKDRLDSQNFKIMICHHRLTEISHNNNNHCLQELYDRNVFLALVGDLHRTQPLFDTINGIQFIPAGTLMAKQSERKFRIDVINREFNVYDIDMKKKELVWSTHFKSADWDKLQRKTLSFISYKS